MTNRAAQRLTIIMCTHNGARHLEAQLASIVEQTMPDWDLWVSDDGSRDGTLEILSRFQREHGAKHDIRLLEGPRGGATRNFFSLLLHPALPDTPVALADQDDVWLPNKLERARDYLAQHPPEEAVLYGAQTLHANEDLSPIKPVSRQREVSDFANSVVQCQIGGHTMVLSRAAVNLLRDAGEPENIAFFDWWVYTFILAGGHHVYCDTATVSLYRQHADNEIGSRHTRRGIKYRIKQLLNGSHSAWVRANLDGLAASKAPLAPKNLALISALRAGGPVRGMARIRWYRSLGVRRTDRAGGLALALSTWLGRS